MPNILGARRLINILTGCLLLLLPGTVHGQEEVAPLPFKPGEKMVYQLRWGIVPAGTATLEVLPPAPGQPAASCRFRLTTETNAFVDTFYQVRDRIESITDKNLHQSLLYTKRQREGSTKRDVVVRFDTKAWQAHYDNKGVEQETIDILPGTIDPLAAFYYLRTQPLRKGLEISKPITDGQRMVDGYAKVVKRQSMTIRDTKYDTYLVEPELKEVRGVFEKSKDASIQLWFTADERHLLVRIKSEVAVGSFYAVLIDSGEDEGKGKGGIAGD